MKNTEPDKSKISESASASELKPLLCGAEWISHKTPPELYQKVIGRSKSMDGKFIYYCGEYTGLTRTSIMIKTWHYEENITRDGHYREVCFAAEWLPLL